MRNKKGNVLVIVLSGFLLLAIGAAGFFFWQNQQLQNASKTQYPQNNNQTTFPIPSTRDETNSSKTYTNEAIGISFNYPSDFGSPEVKSLDINTSISESTKVFSGKSVEIVFHPNAEKYGYNYLKLSAYSDDFKRFLDTPFNGSIPLENDCVNPLQYDKKGNVCVIKTVGNIKAILTNEVAEHEGAIAFITKYNFNNMSSSTFKGLSLWVFFKDIGDEIDKNYSCCADPEAEAKIAKAYAIAKQKSQDIIEQKNLSPEDLQGMQTIDQILSSLKFQ